ncbi:MAG: cation:proton antiporter, partial [Phycisphaerae bacterium]|nr:cation:proton antiporter [Phycisphaerae bacterium]
KFGFVKSQLRTIVRVVRSEFATVVIAVWATLVAIMLLAPLPLPLQGNGWGLQLYWATMVAVLAVASSPAATIALIREMRPSPEFARLALAITVIKDVALVVIFSALLSAGLAAIGPSIAGGANHAAASGAQASGASALLWLPITIGMQMVGSLALGGVVAAILWALGRFINMRIELFLMLVCYGIAVVSAELRADPLLVALTAGLILTNVPSSRAMPRLLASMDGLLLPVYCVFFAVAGAKLHLDAMTLMWPAMAVVVVVRLAAKYWAVTRAAHRAGVPEPTATWLWTTTLPQAGVTLAMAIQFERTFHGHAWAPSVAALLLAVVACNELIGPPLMKLGIQRTLDRTA